MWVTGTWVSVVVARGLYSTGLIVVAHRLRCSALASTFLSNCATREVHGGVFLSVSIMKSFTWNGSY